MYGSSVSAMVEVLVEHGEEEIAKKMKDFKHSSEDSTHIIT